MRQDTAWDLRAIADAGEPIAFQGEAGAFSHQACMEVFPDLEPLPCATFEDAIAATRDGRARLAMLPVENSLYGRVADIHHLLPESGLYLIGEYFLPIRMQLLGLPDATLEDIQVAQSLNVALGQVRNFLRTHNITPEPGPDTAGSARLVRQAGDKSRAAVASTLAAEVHGLKVIAANIEDAAHNTTRFVLASRRRIEAEPGTDAMTTFVFRVRNLPAALYKAMGGFATNGINMVRLESYMLGGSFTATQFVADIEGHPEDPAVARALEELAYFTDYMKILGVYPPHPFRRKSGRGQRARDAALALGYGHTMLQPVPPFADGPRFDSVEAFLDWSAAQPDEARYELHLGEPVRMQSERLIHSDVKFRIARTLDDAVRQAGPPCRTYVDGPTVPIIDEIGAYIPDALVHCGGPPDPESTVIADPMIVVEVVSPSTVRIDTFDKYPGYFSVPSIMHYLMVHPVKRHIVHHRRSGDRIEAIINTSGTGRLTFDPPGLSAEIADFFPDPVETP